MTTYLDTSALVPLLLDEPGSAQYHLLLDRPGRVTSSMITLVEASAALSRAQRAGRLSARAFDAAQRSLDDLWTQITPLPLTDPIVRFASLVAHRYQLRGYDAMQCASALAISDEPDFVVASGDHGLLTAWDRLGLYTVDIAG